MKPFSKCPVCGGDDREGLRTVDYCSSDVLERVRKRGQERLHCRGAR